MKWFSKIHELAGQEYERYLPTAFDESLTLLEKVNKVIETLNQIVLGVNTVADYVDEHVDTQNEKIKQLRDDFEILKEWLENEGLEERTEQVLNEWFDNGRLAQIINNDVFDMKADKATFEQFVLSTTAQLQQTEQELSSQLAQTETSLTQRVDNLVIPISPDNANVEVTDAHVSATKAKTFPSLTSRFEEIEQTASFKAVNLINGDFSGSLTGWFNTNSTIQIQNEQLLMTGTGTGNPRVETPISPKPNGHKLYFKTQFEALDENISELSIYYFDGVLHKSFYNQKPTKNVVTQADGIVEVMGQSYQRFYYAANYDDQTKTTGDTLKIAYPLVVDLTEIFGAGSEPSIEVLREVLRKFPYSHFDKTFSLLSSQDIYKILGEELNKLNSKLSTVEIPAEKQTLDVVLPEKVYTVHNPSAEGYALPIYIDYLFNKKTDVRFENGSDKYVFYDVSNNGYDTTESSEPVTRMTKNIAFKSENYVVPSKTVEQVSTKRDIANKPAFVLCIGDSVTSLDFANQFQYWQTANELFVKEAHDRKTTNVVKFLGARNNATWDTVYKDATLTNKANAEGRSGWSLHDYLRHTTNQKFNQAHWDKLGLGDGSGTDYVGTEAQKKLIRTTPETNTSENVDNYFFDNSKTGSNRFSIKKWIERYRTLDDNGNKLALGSGTGSLINESNIDKVQVCTPTHIVLAFGHNDMEIGKGTVSEFHANLEEIRSTIKAELPDVTIITVCSIPIIGLWNKSFYPNYLNIPNPSMSTQYRDNANYLVNYFKSIDEEATKNYLLPQYFVTPTAEGFPVKTQIDGAGNKYFTPHGGGITSHPNPFAHANWGYQLYSLLKYTMTL